MARDLDAATELKLVDMIASAVHDLNQDTSGMDLAAQDVIDRLMKLEGDRNGLQIEVHGRIITVLWKGKYRVNIEVETGVGLKVFGAWTESPETEIVPLKYDSEMKEFSGQTPEPTPDCPEPEQRTAEEETLLCAINKVKGYAKE